MQNLKEYIKEGIFDNNVKTNPTLNGIEVTDEEWRRAQEFFKKRKAKYFHNLKPTDIVELGDMSVRHMVLYNGDDCIICELLSR